MLGFDVDQDKVAALNSGQSSIEHISDLRVSQAVCSGFECTSDFRQAKQADALILCVPTPLSKYREPDLSFVLSTIESLLPHLRVGQVLSLESTTYPGTTEEELLPRISSRGFHVGEDFFLVYSPEREDPGNTLFTTDIIPKVVGGHSRECLRVGESLYKKVTEQVVPVSSTQTAEMTKLLENIHRAVNIGLVNEMKVVADKMGIDIFEVIDAAATKPFGFTPYYPGPGLGGHCIPIDPFYLTWKAREYGINTRFIELSGEINAAMPGFVVGKVLDVLNRDHKSINGSKILVIGIAYKANVDDMRESPSVEIMELLRDLGATLCYHDPHVPVFPTMRDHNFLMDSIALDENVLSEFDVVVIATNHNAVDYDLVLRAAKRIVDTRGVYRSRNKKVERA